MVAKPISYYLPPALLALNAALAVGGWYLRPEHAVAWAMAVVLLGGMTLTWWLVPPRMPAEIARRRARDGITSGIVFAGVILLVSLGVKLAKALGVSGDAELSYRLMMVVLGAFLMFTGNAVPKTLKSLSAMQCDAPSVQTFQRLAGWTGVLTGVALTFAWLALPVRVAEVISILVLPSSLLIIAAQLARLRRTRRRAA